MIPALVFTLLELLARRRIISSRVTTVITLILIPVFIVAMAFNLVWMAFGAATATTTNIDRYPRALRALDYPESELVAYFPARIPEDATAAKMSYSPQFLQGGGHLILDFVTDDRAIESYQETFAQQAVWRGIPVELEEKGVGFFHLYGYLEHDSIPDDTVVYLMYSEPYQEDSWNHGKVAVGAISEAANEVLYQVEYW